MKGPLRRVVGIVYVEIDQYGTSICIPRVQLECGHYLGVKEDRFPIRRRCWKCERSYPSEVNHD